LRPALASPAKRPLSIARESIVSAVVNGVISVGFFILVFGWPQRIAVRGLGNYAFDFLPQSFAIGLMASLVPGLLARKSLDARRQAGAIAGRSLLNGLVALVIGGGALMAAFWSSGPDTIPVPVALALKVLYGAALGAVVTRAMLLRLSAKNL
jgi:hypothetical protein